MSDLPPSPPPPPPPGGGYGAGPAGGGAYGTPPLAEIGPRVVAFLIDWVAVPFGGWIAVVIISAILGSISGALGSLFFFLGWLAIIGYGVWVCYQEGTTGQSVGKKMQNIKLVGIDNGFQPIGFGMDLARNFINSLCGLFWLLPFFDAQRQTVGDKVSKSIVVPS